MRIYKVAVLVDGADAVRISVGSKARGTSVLDCRLTERADVRLDRLRVDAGEQRIQLRPDLDMVDVQLRENV